VFVVVMTRRLPEACRSAVTSAVTSAYGVVVPSRRISRPDPLPLETDDVKLVAAGTAAWAVALLVLVAVRLAGQDVQGWWMGMCGYGIALGLFGVRYCRRRHEAIERDKAAGIPQRS
jgi:hypothetical protein